MKTKIPTPDEVKKLIAAAEELQQLEKEKTATTRQLIETQKELRRAISSALYIAENPSSTLSELINLLRKHRPTLDQSMIELIAREKQLSEAFDSIADKLAAGMKRLNPMVSCLCDQVRITKLADYDELVREIAGKLAPYCEGDQESASALARQTSAAIDLFTQSSSCDRVIYGNSNLLAPLQAVLRAINA